jgi:hypothetical protein
MAITNEDFGKLVTRIPKRVYARQWLPYSRLPYVDDILIDVTSSQFNPDFQQEVQNSPNPRSDEMFKSPYRAMKACLAGIIKYQDGSTEKIMPREFVLYHEAAKMPIGKISEDDYISQYSDTVELCASCQAKIFVQNKIVRAPQNLADIVDYLAKGKEIKLEDGTLISSKLDLEDWARKKGISLSL